MTYFDRYKRKLQAKGSYFTDALLNSTDEFFNSKVLPSLLLL